MKHWLTPLVLALLATAFTGCGIDAGIVATGLKVELAQVERAPDGTVHAAWRLKNPNVVPYLVDRITHRIYLEGQLVGTVTDTTRLGVAPQSVAERTSPLALANASAGEQIQAAAAKGSAHYRIESTVWLLIVEDQIEKATLRAEGATVVVAR